MPYATRSRTGVRIGGSSSTTGGLLKKPTEPDDDQSEYGSENNAEDSEPEGTALFLPTQ
jgi:hypothetical protein